MRGYETYVRPLVEHNSVIWSPSAIGDIEDIERVQRKFTKEIKGLQNCPYTERLKRLNLHGLELRRLHTDLHGVTKYTLGLLTLMKMNFMGSSVLHTRSHGYKHFIKIYCELQSMHFL